MGVKLSEMTVITAAAGTEKLLALDGSTSKTMTPAVLSAYTIDVIGAAATATPTTGDYLYGYRGTDEKRFTLNNVATYTLTYAYSNASTVTPAATGDSLLVQRSGTVYDMNVSTLATYVYTTTPTAKSAVQLGVLDLSGLDSASLDVTDLLAVCEGTAAKKATLLELETKLWTDFASYIAGLGATSTVADANLMYILQSGVPKYVTATKIADYVTAEIIAANGVTANVLGGLDSYVIALTAHTAIAGNDTLYVLTGGTTEKKTTVADLVSYVAESVEDAPWVEVPGSHYTATPPSTSTLTMSDTSDFQVGYPVKYVYGGLTYYGIVTAVNSNALLTVAGAPLDTGVDITALYVGKPERVIVKDYFIDTAAMSVAQDMLSAVTLQRSRWEHADAYLVSFEGTLGVIDTGTYQPKINVKIEAGLVSNADATKGLTLSSTAGTWTASTATAIDTTNYDIIRGDDIDIRCTEAGTNGDAESLSVQLVFVLE